jgi:CheY-like chemotaxis protein
MAVASGSEALVALAIASPDVLVTDLRMPGMDGYDLLAAVRAGERGSARRLPAIALTAYATVQDRNRALAAGFDLHLPKPVEPSDLLRAVAALGTRREP